MYIQRAKKNKFLIKTLSFTYLLAFLVFVFLFYPVSSNASGIGKPPNNLGLVGYWSLNEGVGTVATDFSGNGKNGLLSGMEAEDWIPGIRGRALNFDGSGEYISLTQFNYSSITVSAWFYRAQLDAVNADAVFGGWYWTSNAQARQGYDLRFAINNTNLSWNVETTNGTTVTESVSFGVINLNQWYHAVGTYDSATGVGRLYINGNQVSTFSTTAGNTIVPLTQYTDTRIGYSRVNNGYFPGRIDEVRVYNRALSAAEVQALYNSGSVKLQAAQNKILTQGMLAMWSFDGGSITTNQILDVSAYGNHGGFINGATSTAKTIGKTAQALSFDGVNDYMKTSFGPSLTDMTIALWVYLDDPPTAEENAIGAYDNDSNGSLMQITFGLGTTVTTPQMYVGDAQNIADYDTVTSSVSLETRRWYHVAAVHDADGRNIIYVDGVDTVNDAASTKSDGSMDFSGQAFTIGARNLGSGGGPDTFFDGRLDEVRVYNRALSASEVKLLYNTAAESKFNTTSRNFSDTIPAVYWTFDGADMTTRVADLSSRANHGSLKGQTSTTTAIGKVGQALMLDGTNDFVINSAFSEGTNGAVTISVWAKPATITANQYLVDYGQASGTDSRSIILGFQDGYWNIFKNAYPTGVAADTQIAASGAGKWDHVVYTSNGSILRGYLNGQLVIDVSANLNRTANPAGISIGRPIDVDSDYYKGVVDEVRIYNKYFTAAEVLQLYNRGR